MSERAKDASAIWHGECWKCGETERLTAPGLCAYCTSPADDAVEELREAFEEIAEEYDYPTAFWSLDELYDEKDGQMGSWGEEQ